MYEVMIEEEFSAAHALRGYRGKCENMHGHNWKVEVYVRGEQLDQVGMLVDFKELKEATRRVMKYLDHQNLNELKPFDERVKVYKGRVWETPSTCATYEQRS